MSTLFISDLHLEDDRPEMTHLLLEFLDQRASQADALYILGDLFEYWVGDDVLTSTATSVGRALSKLSSSSVPVRFIHGNRDFLLGGEYAAQAGMTLLDDCTTIDLYGTPTLLLHGDILCTGDLEYQAFRRQVRDPVWQQEFLSRSVAERLNLANQARQASAEHTFSVPDEIMDVSRQAVLEAFAKHGVQHMIHGHTHRPGVEEYDLQTGIASRTVLGDWYRHGSVLAVNPGKSELITLPLSQ